MATTTSRPEQQHEAMGESAESSGRGRFNPGLPALAGIVATTLIGLVHLPMPFGGDAALMVVIGRQMSEGAVLYQDALDVRQPLIFWFAAIAGSIFGFGEVGIHLAELAVLVAATVPLTLVMRRYLELAWTPALIAPFVVGVYYLSSQVWQLTEPEAFAGPILVAIAWIVGRLGQQHDLLRAGATDTAIAASDTPGSNTAACDTAGSNTDRAGGSSRAMVGLLVAMGALVGLVGLLKLTFLAIAGVIALIALVDGVRSRRVVATILWPAVGLAAVVVPVLALFAIQGVLDDALWLWFEYAPGTIERAPRPSERLWDSAVRFGTMWLPLLPLAAGGVMAAIRQRDRFLIGLSLWLVVGGATILLQHWWDYLFLVLMFPVGLLAVVGLDVAWSQLHSFGTRVLIAFALCAMAIPVARHGLDKATFLAQNGFAASQEDRDAIHDRYAERYRPARQWRSDLGDDRRSIHFVGDATSLWVSGRDQDIPVHGWAADFLDDEMWARMGEDLDEADTAHLWLWSGIYDLMDRRSPDIRVQVERDYCFIERYGDHDWWVLRSDVDGGRYEATCYGSGS